MIFFSACKFIKNDTLAQMFFCEFCKIFKNTYFADYFQRATSNDTIIARCFCFLKMTNNFNIFNILNESNDYDHIITGSRKKSSRNTSPEEKIPPEKNPPILNFFPSVFVIFELLSIFYVIFKIMLNSKLIFSLIGFNLATLCNSEFENTLV